ncbi:MAG TPA: DUF58 domain-containing protein [Thermoplasmata archaeon]|nr:DUF58 domain-containing protein [Thermoplasmata archaeon]
MSGEAPSFAWTSLTFLLVGAGAVLLVVGVAARDPVPLFLALPLLVAPPVAALTGMHRSAEFGLRWGAFGSAQEVRVSGVVTPVNAEDAPDLVVGFTRPASLVESRAPEVAWGEGEVTFRLHWAAPEPTVTTVLPPTVVWRDPTGLAERRATRAHDPIPVERFPPELLRLGGVRLEHTLALPGETPSHRIGPSGEFFGLREASPSEPPRRINWRATARTGRLLANEYEADRTGDVLVIVDARPTPLGRSIDERLLGVARAAAFGVADSFLREKARVGYASFGEFLDPVPLAGGRVQRLRIREAIRRTELARTGGPSERCAVAARRFFPNGVTTLLFTSLAEETTFDLVPHLRRRGYPVAVLSPSPLPLLPRTPPLDPRSEQLVERLERLERRSRVARAWQDAPVIDWQEYWSLGSLVNLLRHPGRGRGV